MSALAPLELRDSSTGTLMLTGYACRTNVDYEVGAYVERVRSGAFKRSLTNPNLQTHLLVEHGGIPIASTESGTLRLGEDALGLRVEADLDRASPRVQEIASALRRNDLREMSFAFRAVKQSWSDDYTHREILEAEVHRGDVSLVGFGANSETSVALVERSQHEWAGLPLEVRAARAAELGQRVVTFGSQFGRAAVAVVCPHCGSDATTARQLARDRYERELREQIARSDALASQLRLQAAAVGRRTTRAAPTGERELRAAIERARHHTS